MYYPHIYNNMSSKLETKDLGLNLLKNKIKQKQKTENQKTKLNHQVLCQYGCKICPWKIQVQVLTNLKEH